MTRFLSSLFCCLLFISSALASKEEALKLWSQRDIKQNMERALQLFEELHTKAPTNLEYLTYLTQGYYFMGAGFTDDTDEKKAYFEKGRLFGEKGLMTNAEFKKRFEKDGMEKSLDSVTVNEATVLFWAASNLGSWARANGVMSSLGYKGQIQAMITRTEALNANVFYGGVQRYWGAFYSLAPGLAGGDMEKSKAAFEKALQLEPNYLGTKVLMAETYLVKKDDKTKFEAVLKEVLAAKADHPQYGPENKIEQQKAQRLLKKVHDLF